MFDSPIHPGPLSDDLFEALFHRVFPQAETLTIAEVMRTSINLGLKAMAFHGPVDLRFTTVVSVLQHTLAATVQAQPGLTLLLEKEQALPLVNAWHDATMDDPAWWHGLFARRRNALRIRRNRLEGEGNTGRELESTLRQLQVVCALEDICVELKLWNERDDFQPDFDRIAVAACKLRAAVSLPLDLAAETPFPIGSGLLKAWLAEFGDTFLSFYEQQPAISS